MSALPETSFNRVEIVPSGKALGADIRGPRLPDMTDQEFGAVRQALRDHKVVRMRDQFLTTPELVALGQRLGPLEKPGMSITGKPFMEDFPDVLCISNITENGVPKGNLGAGEAIWHSDMTYRDDPIRFAILSAIEIPEEGGNTYFANLDLAFERLSDELKEQIRGKVMNHDESQNSAGQLRKGFEKVTDVSKAPGARHKIVHINPETGREFLVLGRRRNAWIVGMDVPKSETLLDTLWAEATQEEYSWGHEWKTGDILIWDNWHVLHRRDAFEPTERRMLHRVQTHGGSMG